MLVAVFTNNEYIHLYVCKKCAIHFISLIYNLNLYQFNSAALIILIITFNYVLIHNYLLLLVQA